MTTPGFYQGVFGSPFTFEMLSNVQRRVYEVEYPQYNAVNIFPVTSEARSFDQYYVWELMDFVGKAKIVSDYADDLPSVDAVAAVNTTPIFTLGDSYHYSVLELDAAINLNRPLQQSKGIAARRAIDALVNDLTIYGDDFYNIKGLLTNDSIPEVAPIVGVGGSTLWSAKTAQEILTDLNNLVQFIITNSKNVERPNRIALSNNSYGILQNTLTTAVGGVSVLEFFRSTHPYIEDIIPMWELDGAGPGGTNMAIAFNNDPTKLSIEMPEIFRQLEPQQRNLTYYTLCYSRFAGLIVRYPASMSIMKGI